MTAQTTTPKRRPLRVGEIVKLLRETKTTTLLDHEDKWQDMMALPEPEQPKTGPDPAATLKQIIATLLDLTPGQRTLLRSRLGK